jgi:DNA repair exonuclease SbcCD ATPase subunit
MDLIETKNIETLTTEILIYKEQVGTGIIEIGKRLIKAKELVGHGNWLNYLSEKVDFTDQTARKFIKIAENYPNSKTTLNMGTEKLYLLLDVPSEERETFIESKHVVNDTEKTVNEMTTRELQKVIQEKKAIENQLNNLENELFNKDKQIKDLINKPAERIIEYKDNPEHLNRLHTKENELRNLTNNLRNMESELQRLKTLENRQKEIETTYKQIENLKKQRSEGIQQLNDEREIFQFIERTKDFIKKEMLHIPTLTTHFNNTNTIKNSITTIVETLDNFNYALKMKFEV